MQVCLNGFLSLHGISRGRIRRLQECLVNQGISPKDMRGKHQNRYKKTPEPVIDLIIEHIQSFKARQSHYSRRKNPNKLYLPESLSVKDMHKMFLNQYHINVSYLVYWSVFHNRFNISFGLPRSDTCSVCDKLQLKINTAEKNGSEQNQLITEKNLHLAKADKFYELKRMYKRKAQMGEVTCLSFDFMQNLPLPHIRTSDVFFASQLWYYVFGVHDIGANLVTMYVYDEMTARKGQNDVISLLLHYMNNNNVNTDTLVLFSDGCPGQNKNYLMVNFLYFLVHGLKMFKTILYIFPIRGHSRLPNDQDFSLIELKKRKNDVEVQSGWDEIIKAARTNPSPFNVVNASQDKFFNMSNALSPYFYKKSKPPMKLKSVRSLKISAEYTHIKVRHTYSGPWETINVRNHKIRCPSELTLTPLYREKILLKPNKLKSVLHLSQFLKNPENKAYYESLNSDNPITEDSNNVEIDSDDNSSAEEN